MYDRKALNIEALYEYEWMGDSLKCSVIAFSGH